MTKIKRDSINELKFSKLPSERLDEALNLIHGVFWEFNAPMHSEEAKQSFTEVVNYEDYKERLERKHYEDSEDLFFFCFDHLLPDFDMWICEDNGEIVGVLAADSVYIDLLYVDGKYHRRGIAKKLFSMMLEHFDSDEVSLISSPYAVKIYKKLGFRATGEELHNGGMSAIPMTYIRSYDVSKAA